MALCRGCGSDQYAEHTACDRCGAALPRIPDGVTPRLTLAARGARGRLLDTAWSPDGRRLAASDSEGVIRVWDGQSGELLPGRMATSSRAPVMLILWSPDGATLAAGSDDAKVYLWDGLSGELRATLSAHFNCLEGLAWSPDGSALASGAVDRCLRLWDIQQSTQRLLVLYQQRVSSLAWSPDGATLAVGVNDSIIHLLDCQTWRETARLAGHEAGVTSVAWSPDGRRLISASLDGRARVWDVQRCVCTHDLAGFSRGLRGTAWSADGRLLALAGFARQQRAVTLWNSHTWEIVATLEGAEFGMGAGQRLSVSSALAVCREDQVQTYDLDLTALLGLARLDLEPDGETTAALRAFSTAVACEPELPLRAFLARGQIHLAEEPSDAWLGRPVRDFWLRPAALAS